MQRKIPVFAAVKLDNHTKKVIQYEKINIAMNGNSNCLYPSRESGSLAVSPGGVGW